MNAEGGPGGAFRWPEMIVLNRSPVLPNCTTPLGPSRALVEVIVFRFYAVNAFVAVSTIT